MSSRAVATKFRNSPQKQVFTFLLIISNLPSHISKLTSSKTTDKMGSDQLARSVAILSVVASCIFGSILQKQVHDIRFEFDAYKKAHTSETSRKLQDSLFDCTDDWCFARDHFFVFSKGVVVGKRNFGCDYGESFLSVDAGQPQTNGLNCPSGLGSVTFGTSNIASADYATVTGGGGNTANGPSSTIAGGYSNEVNEDGLGASVFGGYSNVVDAELSTVIGGGSNKASGYGSSVLGGFSNEANGEESVVVGGSVNQADDKLSAVFGGQKNKAQEFYASVFGGYGSKAEGGWSSAVGGQNTEANEDYSTSIGGQPPESCVDDQAFSRKSLTCMLVSNGSAGFIEKACKKKHNYGTGKKTMLKNICPKTCGNC